MLTINKHPYSTASYDKDRYTCFEIVSDGVIKEWSFEQNCYVYRVDKNVRDNIDKNVKNNIKEKTKRNIESLISYYYKAR